MIILFKEVPEGKPYLKDHYTPVKPKEAFDYIEKGFAVGYDPAKKEEYNPLLPEDFPNRKVLIENGIYTLEILDVALPTLKDLKGLGEKKIQEIKDTV